MKTLSISNVRTFLRPAAALVLLLGSFAATAQMAPPTTPMTMSKGMNAPGHANVMSGSDMKQSMSGMQEKMVAMTMTGDVDYDFASMMRVHHQGAIDMAQMELEHGKSPAMRASAKKIIAAQKKEIVEFDRWMKSHPAKAAN